MTQEILETLQGWFVERIGRTVSAQSPYLKEDGLDSFDAITFISFVEERFAIQLRAEDIQAPAFGTLNGVAAVIQSHRERATT